MHRVDPNYTLSSLKRDKRVSDDPTYNAETADIEGLRKAGLPEK